MKKACVTQAETHDIRIPSRSPGELPSTCPTCGGHDEGNVHNDCPDWFHNASYQSELASDEQ